jgi:hypothetical protein
MVHFLDSLKKISLKSFYTSSPAQRNLQRSNAMVEVAAPALEEIDFSVIIPNKFAQTLISLYGLFRKDTHRSEKIVHFLQASLASIEMGLVIFLLFKNESCDSNNNISYCNAIFLSDLLYKGTLLLTWGSSELSKDLYPSVVKSDNFAVQSDNSVLPVKNKPIELMEDKPIELVENNPVVLVENKPVVLVEDKPVVVVENTPLLWVEDKRPVSEDNTVKGLSSRNMR